MQGDEANDERRATGPAGRRRCGRREKDVPAVVQPLALDADFDVEVEQRLARLVLAAQTGSADARNELHALLRTKLGRWVDREWLAIRDRTEIVEPGDIEGEAFLVLADLIEQWPGAGGFGAYVMRVFPWRLRAAVREQAGLPVRLRQTSGDGGWLAPVAVVDDAGGTPVAGLLAEETWLAEQVISLLEALSQSLDETDRLMLVWRVRDGQSMTAIARRLGMNRRTAHRRWERLTDWIRAEWAA